MNEPNPYQSPREVVQEVDPAEQPKNSVGWFIFAASVLVTFVVMMGVLYSLSAYKF